MNNNLFATIVLGCVGVLITAYYSRHTKKIADEKLLKQLFTEFNERYDKLNNYLATIQKHYSTLDLLEKAGNADELKQKVIDYFMLCSEQFYWYHHKKRIEPLIWNSWQSGMNYWYNNVPVIRDLWEKEVDTHTKKSYYITGKVEFFVRSEHR